ncbi:MAG: hypothetical protein P8144_04575 [Gammaproteobacteria bacterium]
MRGAQGFSLFEVAVALFLVSMCIAGGIYLHQLVLSNAQASRYRAATILAADNLVINARTNATSLNEGAYDYTLNADGTSTLASAALPQACVNTFCTGRQIAALDLYLFQQQLLDFIGKDVVAAVRYIPADPPPGDPRDANKLLIRIQWDATEQTGGALPEACAKHCYELSTIVCENLGNCL